MRFHVLGIPHTISTPEYSTCAFTQKVIKLCEMLMMEGHHVIHYGHSDSEVKCSEHVTVTTADDTERSYPKWNWRKQGWPRFAKTDPCYVAFYRNTIAEIASRKLPGDFLLCSFGDWHIDVARAYPDMLIVEPGIGYPNGIFAPYRVFESYAIMHAFQGMRSIERSRNDFWHDAVIPNAFNLKDFKFSERKDNYFLFLGRINAGKGVHIAAQIASAAQTKLVVAGAGDYDLSQWSSFGVEKVGVVGPRKRAKLLSKARAVLCPSTFLEPFCGTHIEAMLSGTPVISSDWGAFTEYNLHGRTGFRARTFEQFLWAANHIDEIEPKACRDWAQEFSLEKVAPMYTDYFQAVADSKVGVGWYTRHAGRPSLDATIFGRK